MHYVFFHPNGDDGWSWEYKKMKKVTACDYYKYRIMVRSSRREKNPILMGGRLFQQWLVDQYIKVETGKLRWVSMKSSQKKLRAEFYKGAMDAMASDKDIRTIGKKIILPASFTGKYCSHLTTLQCTTTKETIPTDNWGNSDTNKVVLLCARESLSPNKKKAKMIDTVTVPQSLLLYFAIYTRHTLPCMSQKEAL